MSLILNPIYIGVSIGVLGIWIVYKAFSKKQTSLEYEWMTHNGMAQGELSHGENIRGEGIRGGNIWSSTGSNLRSRMEYKSFRILSFLGKRFERMQADLNLASISPSQQAFLKIRTALVGGIAAFFGIYIFRYLGVIGDSNWLLALAVGISLIFGFILPDRKVKEAANKSRELMRGAFIAYLDLIKILLAGGCHTDGALFQAASIGQGWAFSKLRAAIDWSRVNGQPIPAGLNRLAEETGVKEIEELAAIAVLADKEGTSLKETLARKAELLATKDLAEARVKSQAISEKMSVPTVVIALSFVAFIAYPALASLTTNAAS